MRCRALFTDFLPYFLIVLFVTNSPPSLAKAVDLTSTQTSLNGCEKKEGHDFKREKSILEKCPAKAGFHVFIQGETEETLKLSLEREIAKPLIWDNPFAKEIKILGKHDAQSTLNGEITGSYISWVIEGKDNVVGIVLKRLQEKAKTFEAFRFMDESYFCHVGGNTDHNQALELIKTRESCI